MICFSFSQTIVILISINFITTIGQKIKSSQWPPRPVESEFIDTDRDNIRGTGGKDYPIYASIPKTSFTCKDQIPGFYADPEAECQVFHLCFNRVKTSFLCGNGTIFNQKLFTCNWWYNTTCGDSHKYYSLNSQLYKPNVRSNESQKQKLIINNENKNLKSEKVFSPQKQLSSPKVRQSVPTRTPQQLIRERERQRLLQINQNVRHFEFQTESDVSYHEMSEFDGQLYYE